MKVSLIAALDEDGVIGRDGGLPWRLPADLARFKALTLDHHLIVGRRTWDSIGRPLPGRRMVVVSRGRPGLPGGVELASSVEAALERAREAGETEAFVGGGAEIYRRALPRADRLYLTRVRARVGGDVRFPEIDPSRWHRVSCEERAADERHPYPLSFCLYERTPA